MTEIDQLVTIILEATPSAPWMILGALALREAHRLAVALCPLVGRTVAAVEAVARDGVRVQVQLVDQRDGGEHARPARPVDGRGWRPPAA